MSIRKFGNDALVLALGILVELGGRLADVTGFGEVELDGDRSMARVAFFSSFGSGFPFASRHMTSLSWFSQESSSQRRSNVRSG
jgi:hypothetical protein